MGEVAPKKLSKTEAEYRPWPKGWSWCGRCTMFVKPNACTLVDGKVEAQGYCVQYKRKNGEKK